MNEQKIMSTAGAVAGDQYGSFVISVVKVCMEKIWPKMSMNYFRHKIYMNGYKLMQSNGLDKFNAQAPKYIHAGINNNIAL